MAWSYEDDLRAKIAAEKIFVRRDGRQQIRLTDNAA